MARGSGCLAGVVGGSILRGIIKVIGVICKAIANILVFTGLWIPAIYALVGFILKLTGTLNPLDSTMEAKLFQGGFWATVLISVLITFKNIFAPSKKRKQKRELKREEKQQAKKEKLIRERKPPYDYNTREPEHIGFDRPPAPFDNYPSKLSRKEKRKIKKISKEAKEDATFIDDNLKNPIENNIGETNVNSPVYVATIQNGKVVYTPIVNVQAPQEMSFNPNMQAPQEMPFNPNMQMPPQEMPFNPNVQMPPQKMPFNPNVQVPPQKMPYDNTVNTPYSHMPYHPKMEPYQNQNASYYQPNTNINNTKNEYPESHSTNKEEPKIYLSKVESDTLIHEYEDRFEVYKMKDGKAIKDRVEYKRDFS